MKKILVVLLITVVFTASLQAATHIHGYYRKSGRYVTPHYRTQADSSINLRVIE